MVTGHLIRVGTWFWRLSFKLSHITVKQLIKICFWKQFSSWCWEMGYFYPGWKRHDALCLKSCCYHPSKSILAKRTAWHHLTTSWWIHEKDRSPARVADWLISWGSLDHTCLGWETAFTCYKARLSNPPAECHEVSRFKGSQATKLLVVIAAPFTRTYE